jgi:hypothetical protein
MSSICARASMAVGIAFVVAIAIAMAMLWNSFGPSQIDLVGWLALGFGIVATLALAGGLLAAMFISNRRGYDDRIGRDR